MEDEIITPNQGFSLECGEEIRSVYARARRQKNAVEDKMQSIHDELKDAKNQRQFTKIADEVERVKKEVGEVKVMLAELVGHVRAFLMIGAQPQQTLQPPAPVIIQQPQPIISQQPTQQVPTVVHAENPTQTKTQSPMRKTLADIASSLSSLGEDLG